MDGSDDSENQVDGSSFLGEPSFDSQNQMDGSSFLGEPSFDSQNQMTQRELDFLMAFHPQWDEPVCSHTRLRSPVPRCDHQVGQYVRYWRQHDEKGF